MGHTNLTTFPNMILGSCKGNDMTDHQSICLEGSWLLIYMLSIKVAEL